MSEKLDNKKFKRRPLSQTQYIAIGFFIMVMVGTLLLMLPISSKGREWTDFLSALFTATSASCVTGLVVFDTYAKWSLFGQIVLIILIQIGGLGFMTIGVSFSILFRRKIGLRERGRMQESIGALELRGVVGLAKRIAIGTAIIEGTGALLLAIRFIPRMGFVQGVYYAIFHSISAFCNAGFDLMGKYEPYSSFVYYQDDLLVNITLVLLVLIGGLGFIVWDDLYEKKLQFKKYKLQTKLVLTGALIFTGIGALLFYIFERNGVMAGLSPMGKFCSSLFGAVTPRTAGFNTTATDTMSAAGQILTLILMLVGGNSGSTAGGVKVTTIMVLFLFVFASLRQSSSVEVFGRRLSLETVKKAAVVFTINLTLGVASAMVISAMQGFELGDALFETFSAVNTVGMTTGITRDLNSVSRVIIILMMYIGRIGSLTFALSFFKKKDTELVKLPIEEISVG